MVDNDDEHGSTYEERLRWMESLDENGEGNKTTRPLFKKNG